MGSRWAINPPILYRPIRETVESRQPPCETQGWIVDKDHEREKAIDMGYPGSRLSLAVVLSRLLTLST